MSNKDTALMAAELIGGILTVLAMRMTAQQMDAMFDLVRSRMVSENRGPTVDEIQSLMNEIEQN